MRRAMPTRPPCLLKNSQSESPAALAMAFTRREICDSDNPNTFSSLRLSPTWHETDCTRRPLSCWHVGGRLTPIVLLGLAVPAQSPAD